MLGIERSTVHHDPNTSDSEANAEITTTRKVIALILGDQITLEEVIESGDLVIHSGETVIQTFLDSLDSFITAPLIEPK